MYIYVYIRNIYTAYICHETCSLFPVMYLSEASKLFSVKSGTMELASVKGATVSTL